MKRVVIATRYSPEIYYNVKSHLYVRSFETSSGPLFLLQVLLALLETVKMIEVHVVIAIIWKESS